MVSRIELDEEQAVTMEIQQSAQIIAHSQASLNSEEESGGCGKSEAPIVAMNAGNEACANLR